MTPGTWLAFVATSAFIGIVPGPGVASIVGHALSSGRRTALAFAPQFIVGTEPYAPQAAVLIVSFCTVVAATDAAHALAAARVSGLLGRPGARLWSRRTGGAALIASGLAVAATRR